MTHQLLADIEAALQHQLTVPSDFDDLAERIFRRRGVVISAMTLKRLWGYLDYPHAPRRSTLDILAQFIGYDNYDDYCRNSLLPEEQQSAPILNRRLSVKNDVRVGDCLRIIWKPNRKIEITYQGNLHFDVVFAENTRIKAGDSFDCGLIIEDEPLFVDNLSLEGREPVAYVCGKKHGICFEFLPPNE